MNVSTDLINRCINSDRRAQSELYRACYGEMMKVGLRYKKNKEDAQALINQAFLKVCNNLDQYNQASPFDAWLKRITINTAIDDYRKNKTQRETNELRNFSDEYWSNKVTDVNYADAESEADELRALIHALPTISQQVFNMAALDGYEYHEVAEHLDISEATCRWHVHFARKTLKTWISEKESISKIASS